MWFEYKKKKKHTISGVQKQTEWKRAVGICLVNENIYYLVVLPFSYVHQVVT